MTASLDDYRWLLSPEAAPWLARVEADGPLFGARLVQVVQGLRKELSAERAHLIVEQIELRRRAREKFSAAHRMFFTRIGLEQATDERIAAYKAERFTAGPIADLCCGVGGDLMALAARAAACGVELNEVTALLAERNCEVVGRGATVRVQRAEEVDLTEFAAWHIDPDRRPTGKRTTRLELHEPSLAALETMLAANPHAAIKLAPAAELPDSWRPTVEAEWISRGGECRQLVAWHGALARQPGKRAATVIGPSGISSLVGAGDESVPLAPAMGRHVYEPDSAVLAARLTGALCDRHHLAAITAGVAYLTADALIEDECLAAFEVLDVLPFDLKRLRVWHRERGVGQVEVKKRGVDVDPHRVQRELQGAGEERGVVLLAPLHGKVTAILARRV